MPGRDWRVVLGLRRADALWLRDRLLPCALLAVLTAALILLLRSPTFMVHSVRVEGAPTALTMDIVAAAGLTERNIFAVNPDQVAARIATLPDLERVQVRLLPPSTMAISVRVYQPAAIWVSGSRQYLVTQDGMVIKPGDDPALLHLRDGSAAEYRHGDRLPPATVRRAFLLRDVLAAQQVEAHDFTFVDVRSVSVQSPTGWRATFDITGDIAQQARVLAALLVRGTTFQVVDLRFGSEVAYR